MGSATKVFFTSISGVGAQDCLSRLATFLHDSPEYKKSPSILKAEKHFLEMLNSDQMISALGFPKPMLREAWANAVNKLGLLEISGQDVFLSAHAAFHHQLTREFFCPINLELLKAWKPDMIITLVDDIEDCLERLRSKENMFDKITYAYGGIEGFNNSVEQMSLLFDWRAIDILEAERIAADLGVKHYCVATKHPLPTLASLIYKPEKHVTYVSHAISEPRRALGLNKPDIFNTFSKELERVCARLRYGTTLIEPTTIDEFRYKTFVFEEGNQKKTIFLPQLTPRWPTNDNPIHPVSKNANGNPLDPGNFFTEEKIRNYIETKTKKEEQLTKSELLRLLPVEIAVNLLGVLIVSIKEQIDSRDHKLVEQSHELVVIRPAYQGNASHGVEEEIRYHCQLCESGQKRGRLWIYTDKTDELEYVKRSWLPSYLCDKMKIGDNIEKENVIREVCHSLALTNNKQHMVDDVVQGLRNKGMLFGSFSNSPLGPRREKATMDAIEELKETILSVSAPYREVIAHYSDVKCIIREGPDTSIDEFIDEILESCNGQ